MLFNFIEKKDSKYKEKFIKILNLYIGHSVGNRTKTVQQLKNEIKEQIKTK